MSSTQEKLQTNLEKLFIIQAKNFSENIEDTVKQNILDNLYKNLKENESLRDNLQNSISMLITPSFKYIYVLYRDKNGKYRYLLDGSKEDRGEFGQKLNVDKENWDKIYNTKADDAILQKDIENLWGTYLKPIIYNNEVSAVIGIDFSAKLPHSISSVMRPMQNTFIYIFIAIASLLIVLLYQTIINIKTKKNAFTDELTQTFNRTYLKEFLRNLDSTKYQILMFDIDFFKKVNDTYGHKAGDFILIEVAKIIKQVLRKQDVTIRFGGEEFLIFVHKSVNYKQDKLMVAEEIRKSIEQAVFNFEGTIINITTSIGITLYPENYNNISDAMNKADEMLYIAKKSGRNRVISDS
ncbi:MAG: GGDEF domain-containing protein [Campylobacterota bacterium]|nr:GGDEF domain-containing protein [Campylobacterota bacterium]